MFPCVGFSFSLLLPTSDLLARVRKHHVWVKIPGSVPTNANRVRVLCCGDGETQKPLGSGLEMILFWLDLLVLRQVSDALTWIMFWVKNRVLSAHKQLEKKQPVVSRLC